MNYPELYSKVAQIGLAQGGTGAAPPPPDVISFAYGLPDPGSFPVDDLRVSTAAVLDGQSATALQYGSVQGEPRLRQYLAERLNEKQGLELTADQIAVTCGSLQAIGLLAQLMVDQGDTILLEGPTFLGAVRIFRLFQPRLEELALDDQGLVVSELERRLERLQAEGVRPKFLYTMPTFHNPAGVTMPLNRRLELLEVAHRHELLVVEDDAYGDLRFEGPELPSLLALDRAGLVVYLGTFSKILAAGLRLGWAAGPEDVIKALSVLKVDGGTSPYGSHLAANWAGRGLLEPHVQKLRALYCERRDTLIEALEQRCADYCRWTKPEGGFFVWLELNDALDADRLRHEAAELGVAYLPGTQCFASGQGECFIRLAFSFLTPDRIKLGVERLGQAMAKSRDEGR
jgi:2-aminoadipate transaminase